MYNEIKTLVYNPKPYEVILINGHKIQIYYNQMVGYKFIFIDERLPPKYITYDFDPKQYQFATIHMESPLPISIEAKTIEHKNDPVIYTSDLIFDVHYEQEKLVATKFEYQYRSLVAVEFTRVPENKVQKVNFDKTWDEFYKNFVLFLSDVSARINYNDQYIKYK